MCRGCSDLHVITCIVMGGRIYNNTNYHVSKSNAKCIIQYCKVGQHERRLIRESCVRNQMNCTVGISWSRTNNNFKKCLHKKNRTKTSGSGQCITISTSTVHSANYIQTSSTSLQTMDIFLLMLWILIEHLKCLSTMKQNFKITFYAKRLFSCKSVNYFFVR